MISTNNVTKNLNHMKATLIISTFENSYIVEHILSYFKIFTLQSIKIIFQLWTMETKIAIGPPHLNEL